MKEKSLPEDFIRRTRALLGKEWPAFERSLTEESPPVSIRWNPAKEPSPHPFPCSDAVAWASHAYYLPSRPDYTLDPLFHAGSYYVQEASSMYLEQIIRRQLAPQPVKALDLCAAPGGKSTQLLSVLPPGSLLTANEVIRLRASALVENLTKWGNPYFVATQSDPSEFGRRLAGFFDLLLADVPCSGEGLFRKDPSALSEWSEARVRFCSERQRRIIADSWPSLKPGGLLIYSTCTYNREENEDAIDWICRELGAELSDGPHRFFPHKIRGEGFFIAAVRKTGDRAANGAPPSPRPTNVPKPETFVAQQECLLNPDDFAFLRDGEQMLAFPARSLPDFFILRKNLKLLAAGLALGEQKGRDWIPAHALAMSTALNPNRFPRWEMDRTTALRYLRKEALQDLPEGLPTGFLLVTFDGQPLGFVKNIGTRANNLYPASWRIRKR